MAQNLRVHTACPPRRPLARAVTASGPVVICAGWVHVFGCTEEGDTLKIAAETDRIYKDRPGPAVIVRNLLAVRSPVSCCRVVPPSVAWSFKRDVAC